MPTIRKGKVKAMMPLRMAKAEKVKITKLVRVPKMKDSQRAGVLAVVRRMLSRNAENKVIGYRVEQNVGHNSAISSADCEPLVPEIHPIDAAVGSTATQRIGDRIKPKSLTVKGVISYNTANLNNVSDLYVRVIIASQKDIKVGSQILAGSVDTGALLRPGFDVAGTDQVPFNGNTIELQFPINRDKFRVYYDKVFKLSGRSENGVEAVPGLSRRFAYRFKEGNLPASLTFDEGNADWPNNFAPFMAIGYCYADGTSPDTVTTRLITNVFSQLEFEDS